MPLYEYECRNCGHKFEALVTGDRKPECPNCKSDNLEKLLSAFGLGSTGASASSSASSGGCGSSFGGG